MIQQCNTWPSRMRRPAAVWGVATVVCEAAATWVIAAKPVLPGVVRQAVLIAPRLTLLGFLVALVQMARHLDELQRRIALESVYVAFVASLAMVFVFTGLGVAGAWRPRWDLVPVAMMAFWAIGYAYSAWKYR